MKIFILSFSILFLSLTTVAAPLCSDVFASSARIIHETQDPDILVQSMLEDTVDVIDHRTFKPTTLLSGKQVHLDLRAKRNPIMKFWYENQIIDASRTSFRMQDKLMMYKLLQNYLGKEGARVIHPHTVGIKEFLFSRGLVDSAGKVNVSEAELSRALAKEFPNGYIVKPTVGQNSNGKGFYFDSAEIIKILLKDDINGIYSAQERHEPTLVEGQIITGERYILQERLNLESTSAVSSPNEFRVHSYQDQVIDGATLSRWKIMGKDTGFSKINALVQSILSRLPKAMTDRQAWSFDVFRDSSGKMVLVEINTNKGKEGNWSGFVKSPKVLGGYIRHFEKNFNWHINGFAGTLLRNNLGNVDHAVKFAIEKFWNTYIRAYLVYFKKLNPLTKDQYPAGIKGNGEQQ